MISFKTEFTIMLFVRTVLVLFCIASVTGCVVRTDFYFPSAQDGRIKKAHCPPVSSFILFDRKGAIIGVQNSKGATGNLKITLTLEIPQDVTIQLASREILVRDVTDGEASGVRGSLSFSEDLSWDSKLSGSTKKRFWEQITYYGTTEFAYYVLRAEVDFPDSLSHRVTLPPLLINGDLIRLPVVTFSLKRESWLSGGNC
jgi:hypothetical protein